MANTSSGYTQQLADAARRCSVQAAIAEARCACSVAPKPATEVPPTSQVLASKLTATHAASTAPLPRASLAESRRIQARINEANEVWNPARLGLRPPVSVPCPPIPPEYLRVGEGQPTARFACYPPVVGFI
jgi:hypothetical protein